MNEASSDTYHSSNSHGRAAKVEALYRVLQHDRSEVREKEITGCSDGREDDEQAEIEEEKE